MTVQSSPPSAWASHASGPATPTSLTALTEADATTLTGAELTDAIIVSEKALSLIAGLQIRLIAALAEPFTAGDPMRPAARLARKNNLNGDDPDRIQLCVPDAAASLAASEIAAALRISPVTAGIRVRDAATMTTELAPTLHALETGRIDRGKARVIAEHCQPLTPEHTTQVQNLVLPAADHLSTSELRDLTGQAVITVDPAGAEERHHTAAARRDLTLRALPDAMATLNAFLPADGAVKIFQISDLLATSTAGAPADPRGIGARRVDALVDIADHLLTNGYLDLSHYIDNPDHGQHTKTDDSDTAGGEPEDAATPSVTENGTDDGETEHGETNVAEYDAANCSHADTESDSDTAGGEPEDAATPSVTENGTDADFPDSDVSNAEHTDTDHADNDNQTPPVTSTDGGRCGTYDTETNVAEADTAITEADSNDTVTNPPRPGRDTEWKARLDTVLTPPIQPENPTGSVPSTPPGDQSDNNNDNHPPQPPSRPDPDNREHRPGPRRALTRQGRRPHLSVIIGLGTLTSENELPAHLAGFGAIPASLGRAIATSAGTVTAMFADPTTGVVTDAGDLTYRPTQHLRDRIAALLPTCQFPSCRQPVWRCDIDHRHPFDHQEPQRGGRTNEENTGPLCRRHHLIKHHSDWRYRVDPNRFVVEWISPTGHRYLKKPQPTLLPDLRVSTAGTAMAERLDLITTIGARTSMPESDAEELLKTLLLQHAQQPIEYEYQPSNQDKTPTDGPDHEPPHRSHAEYQFPADDPPPPF